MKRLKNLYSEIYKLENIKSEYQNIRKVNRNKNNILNFELNLNSKLLNISNELKNNNYIFNKYKIFLITEPKYRLVMNQSIHDKIINHLVTKYILNKLDKCLIEENVATRKGKGSSYAFNLVVKYINEIIKEEKEIYVLKLDIKKYFYNIDHEILKEKLKRKIKDNSSLELLFRIIGTTNESYINEDILKVKELELKNIKSKNILNKEKILEEIKSIPLYKYGKGLCIGNVTSQFLAVFYLNDIDHYIKEVLKHKYYVRYMDDLVIIDNDKEKLIKSLNVITKMLKNEKLEVNKKTKIYKLKNGFSFIGYNFKINNKVLIRYNTKTIRRIDKKLKKMKEVNYEDYYKSLMSYQGYFKKINSSLKEKFIRSCIMYEKYLNIKKDYKNYIVLIKKGNFYYSYDEDALVINYLFDYKIINNKVGFPINTINKVLNILKKEDISSVVLEGNDIKINKILENERYSEVLGLSYDKLERIECENKLIEMIKNILKNNINHYESIRLYLSSFLKN